MNQTIEEKNKELVLKAFDTLFNKRDYAAAERYWSPNIGRPLFDSAITGPSCRRRRGMTHP